MQFYDREKETALIRDLIRKDHCFLVITGRRRIGKTRLVREALKDEDHLDLFIPRKRMTLALDQLSKMLREQTGYSPTFVDFREFLEYLLRMEDRIIFLDEISNLEHMDKGAFSDIQEMIDRYSAERRIRLIVDGSYAGIMRRIFEDSKEPLFGRATNMLRLQPLPLYYSIKMLMDNGIGFGDAIEMYSLFGGVPRYLELLRAYKDMDELIRNVFSPGSIFLYEGENVLIQEFGSSWDTYFSILEVISRGKFGPTPIANKLGMKVQMLPKYLKTLKDLELIRRRRPIFGKPRHVRYVVNDPFFRFWFKTCYPRIGLFMDGRARLNVEEVRSVVGKGMEKVIMDLFFDTGSFPFEPDQVGSWWDRSGNEVDLLFYNEKKKMMGVGEIKWRSRKVGSRTVEDLLYKIAMIDWYNEKRVEIPFIVSKSGFTETAIDRMEEHGVKGFSMEDLRTAVLKKKALDW